MVNKVSTLGQSENMMLSFNLLKKTLKYEYHMFLSVETDNGRIPYLILTWPDQTPLLKSVSVGAMVPVKQSNG